MKKIVVLLFVATLAACGKSEPTDTVDSLVANPERLKELRDQCRVNHAKLGDELCNRVAEATTQRFLHSNKVPYTPPKDPPKF